MERMIIHRLSTWFLQDNNIITKYHSGFQKVQTTFGQAGVYIRQGFAKINTQL